MSMIFLVKLGKHGNLHGNRALSRRVQHSPGEHSTLQWCTALSGEHSSFQGSTVLSRGAQHSPGKHSTLQGSTAFSRGAQHSPGEHSFLQGSIAFFRKPQHSPGEHSTLQTAQYHQARQAQYSLGSIVLSRAVQHCLYLRTLVLLKMGCQAGKISCAWF